MKAEDVLVEIVRKELKQRLSEHLDLNIEKESMEFKGRTGERFMEDNIVVGTFDFFKGSAVWGFSVCEAVAEAIERLEPNKSAVICIDIWGKPYIGMTSELYKFVRQVIDDVAQKYSLLKAYSWGQDDGGMVVFNDEGKAVIRSYYSRGCLEIDSYGPKTEEEYWSYWTSEEYDEYMRERREEETNL